MKKIFLCVLAVMMAVRVCALELEQIKPQLSKDLNTALEILARNASIEQKSNELFKLFDVYFDYKLMSALALGKIYKSLDNAQKAQFQEKFKERLKELRKDKKLTQKQLADLLGCTNQNINDWETGNSETSFDNLLMLADIFDVTTDYLLGKDEY